MLNDADGQVLYYRRDALSDPEHQQAFQAEYGYELPAPPKTWQQLLDIARYFNGKNWDDNDAEADSGMVLHLKVGEQGHYHFQSLSASFAITPGDEVDQYHNVYWFDPTDMTPLINSPGHLKALEFLQELHKTGPSAQVSWSLGEAWDYFLRGKAVFVFSWGDVGALCQDPARSKIQGVCAASILPASNEYYDHETGEFVQVDDPQPVGNTTGGSWHGVISNFSANPEATYSLLALMAIKEVSMWNAQHGWTGVDPGYSYQFLRARGRGDRRGLRQGRLAPRGRQDLHQGLLRQLLRRHDADLPAHPRHLRVLGHPRQEPVGGDGRRDERQAGPRQHGGELGAGHRPHRSRQPAQGLPGSDRLRRLARERTGSAPGRSGSPAGPADAAQPRCTLSAPPSCPPPRRGGPGRGASAAPSRPSRAG